MRIPRIYQPQSLSCNQEVQLTPAASHYLINVLRLKLNSPLIVFNGQGGEYQAEIVGIEKKSVSIAIKKFLDIEKESPLAIHLGQAISRGEKMDFTIQKAVELGVTKITPLYTEFGNVKLSGDRLEKKIEHWRAIAISACEQCGRNRIPAIAMPETLEVWVRQTQETLKLVLHPSATQHLRAIANTVPQTIALLIGAEGGFSENEISAAKRAHFETIQLGPRVLRTETAGLTIIAALQTLWGDIG